MTIRLVIVDDHPIVLQGLKQLFEREADFAVTATCQDADVAFSVLKRERPDVLLLDLRMPGATGLELIRALTDAGIACPTVLLTAAIDDAEVIEAVKMGVRGLVMKDSAPETLIDAVRRVHNGEQWLDQSTVTRAFQTALNRETAVQDAALTPRELDIVRMVGEGLRNRAIAARLSISEGTVKVHLHNIYEKLGVDGRLELTLCAQQKGLL